MRLALLLTLLGAFSGEASARSLAFTFDDGLNPDTTPSGRQWNAALLEQLKTAGITSIVFPSLAKTGNGEGLSLIRKWSEAGHGVGNHTTSHMNLSSDATSLGAFLEDISRADRVLSKFSTWTPMLRFPFLKEGNDPAKRDGVRQWLRDHGYRAAAVSIDTSDWYYNLIYLKLVESGDRQRLALLHDAYVAHIADRADYYDALAVNVLKRSPRHVILLHVSAINSAWLGDVIAALKKDGWGIESAQSAYTDSLYDLAPSVLPAGESVVWSLAKGAGVDSLRYPAEDAIYEEPTLKAAHVIQ